MDTEKTETKLHAKRLGREMAMQTLFGCEMNQAFPDLEQFDRYYEELAPEHELKDNRYARKSRDYAREILSSLAIHRDEIDRTIKAHSENWDWDRLSAVDRNIMRVAVFEMLYVADVPPVVSINEAVEIARDYSGEKAGNFINGVLNAVKDGLDRPAREAVKELKH